MLNIQGAYAREVNDIGSVDNLSNWKVQFLSRGVFNTPLVDVS